MKEHRVIIRLFGIFLIVITWNCAGNKYKEMASSNPIKLLSIKDSLLQMSSKTHIVHSIALAHKILGDSAIQEGNYEKAKDHFTKALKLLPNDSLYLYSQLMAEGHLHKKVAKKINYGDLFKPTIRQQRFLKKPVPPIIILVILILKSAIKILI